jgi:hypothetical protein
MDAIDEKKNLNKFKAHLPSSLNSLTLVDTALYIEKKTLYECEIKRYKHLFLKKTIAKKSLPQRVS